MTEGNALFICYEVSTFNYSPDFIRCGRRPTIMHFGVELLAQALQLLSPILLQMTTLWASTSI